MINAKYVRHYFRNKSCSNDLKKLKIFKQHRQIVLTFNVVILKSDGIKLTNLHQRTIGIHNYFDMTKHKENRCQRKSSYEIAVQV